jgi:hypothetical protein
MRVDKITMATVHRKRACRFWITNWSSYALRIPRALKSRTTCPSTFSKKRVRDLLPAEIVDRPKQGFGLCRARAGSATSAALRARSDHALPVARAESD